MKQNEDFELIPGDDDEWWNVRILTGEYTETIFRFGKMAIMEDSDTMAFDFSILSSPIDGLQEEDCQNVVSDILGSVIGDAVTKAVNSQ